MPTLVIRLVGGPTAELEYGGIRWLTDPALSPPGEYEGGLVKVTGPPVDLEQADPIDVVLLSHDHHSDNSCSPRPGPSAMSPETIPRWTWCGRSPSASVTSPSPCCSPAQDPLHPELRCPAGCLRRQRDIRSTGPARTRRRGRGLRRDRRRIA
jgi:hypothetical protein